jgi:hypothetical protein
VRGGRRRGSGKGKCKKRTAAAHYLALINGELLDDTPNGRTIWDDIFLREFCPWQKGWLIDRRRITNNNPHSSGNGCILLCVQGNTDVYVVVPVSAGVIKDVWISRPVVSRAVSGVGWYECVVLE